MNHSTKIIDFFDKIFNEKKCHDLCRKYKFIERSSSKLKGHEFIKTMIIPSIGLSTDSLKGLCKRMLDFNPEAILTPQALCERINDISASKLMRGIFAELLLKVNKRITRFCPKITSTLINFNRVLIEDSTTVTLNEKLEDVYKGTNRGGNGVKSQVKIDLIHDLSKGVILDAKLFRGNEPDQSLAERVLSFIKKGDLLLRDLGYFAISAFKAIEIMKAYFLSRLMPRVKFFLKKKDDTPLDIGKHLKNKAFRHLNVIEVEGFLGNEKVPIRLIIYRQPQEVTDKRLREAHKHVRKRGETMSASKKLLMNFSIFITNAPQEFLPTEIIGTIYRLRWEIELVFKQWKNQLEIDYLKGIHRERIDCLIWSRLCTVLIVEFISGIFKNIAEKTFDNELSIVKLIQYLMRNNGFCRAVAGDRLEFFLEQMEKDIPRMILKDKRSRRTMRERVYKRETYYGMRTNKNEEAA